MLDNNVVSFLNQSVSKAKFCTFWH